MGLNIKDLMAYIERSGDELTTKRFDSDHEPSGPQFREVLRDVGLIIEKNGKVVSAI